MTLSGNLAFRNVEVGKTATRTLTIANSGKAPLSVSSINYPAAFSGDFATGTIAAGGTREVKVTFAPTGAVSYGGTITVNGNQTEGPNTMAVSGVGVKLTNVAPRVGGTWKAERPRVYFQWQMSATDDDGDEITWSAAPGTAAPSSASSVSKAIAGGTAPLNFSGTCQVRFQACDRHGACGQWDGGPYTWKPAPPQVDTPASIIRNRFNLLEGRTASGKLEASSSTGGYYGVVGDISIRWDSTSNSNGYRTANMTVQWTNTANCSIRDFTGFFYPSNSDIPIQELNPGSSVTDPGQSRQIAVRVLGIGSHTQLGFVPVGHFFNCR